LARRIAGGRWVDQEVCVDGNSVSSRKPADIPAFNREMLELFYEYSKRCSTISKNTRLRAILARFRERRGRLELHCAVVRDRALSLFSSAQ
jgi:hypothetical protein